MKETINVALAQLAPVWLNKKLTLKKIEHAISEAAAQKADLVAFGETVLPGYPFWIELTDGARLNSTVQKELFAHYLKEAVDIQGGDLTSICRLAKQYH